MKIRVYYEDTDTGGIVYHANYIKYCERARSEHFFARGIMPGTGAKSGFVVRMLKADYLATATLGDLLEVATKIITLKSSSVTLRQEVWRDETLVFGMDVVLVYVEEGKPKRIPSSFKELFEAL
jgi:acyl-CoA thioester hydrolase